MSEIEQRAPSPVTDVVIPLTGEIITLGDPQQVASAIQTLQVLRSQIREVEGQLTDALIEHSKEIGKKTLRFENGPRVEIKGDKEIVYDAEAIMDGLRAAGMPEDRIQEIVVETVEYKVRAVQAKQAASANPEYKAVIDQATVTREKRPYVKIG